MDNEIISQEAVNSMSVEELVDLKLDGEELIEDCDELIKKCDEALNG